jgi:hypothetical protein
MNLDRAAAAPDHEAPPDDNPPLPGGVLDSLQRKADAMSYSGINGVMQLGEMLDLGVGITRAAPGMVEGVRGYFEDADAVSSGRDRLGLKKVLPTVLAADVAGLGNVAYGAAAGIGDLASRLLTPGAGADSYQQATAQLHHHLEQGFEHWVQSHGVDTDTASYRKAKADAQIIGAVVVVGAAKGKAPQAGAAKAIAGSADDVIEFSSAKVNGQWVAQPVEPKYQSNPFASTAQPTPRNHILAFEPARLAAKPAQPAQLADVLGPYERLRDHLAVNDFKDARAQLAELEAGVGKLTQQHSVDAQKATAYLTVARQALRDHEAAFNSDAGRAIRLAMEASSPSGEPPMVRGYNPIAALAEAGHDKVFVGHLNGADRETRDALENLERLAMNEFSSPREKALLNALGSHLGGLRQLADSLGKTDAAADPPQLVRFNRELQGVRRSVWDIVATNEATRDAELESMIRPDRTSESSASHSFFNPDHRLAPVGIDQSDALTAPTTRQSLKDAVIELRKLMARVKGRYVTSGALLSPRFLEQVNGPLFIVAHGRSSTLRHFEDNPKQLFTRIGAEVELFDSRAVSTATFPVSDRYLDAPTSLPLDAEARNAARERFVESQLPTPLAAARDEEIARLRAMFNDAMIKGMPTGKQHSLLSLIEHDASKVDGFAPTQISLAMCQMGKKTVFSDLVKDIRQAFPSVQRVEAVDGPFHVERKGGKGFVAASGMRNAPVVESVDGGAARTVAVLRAARFGGGPALGGNPDDVQPHEPQLALPAAAEARTALPPAHAESPPGRGGGGLATDVDYPGPNGPWVGHNELGDAVHTMAALRALDVEGGSYSGKINVLSTGVANAQRMVDLFSRMFVRSTVVVHTPPKEPGQIDDSADRDMFFRSVKAHRADQPALGHPFDATRVLGQQQSQDAETMTRVRQFVDDLSTPQEKARVKQYLASVDADLLNANVPKAIVALRHSEDGYGMARNSSPESLQQMTQALQQRGLRVVVMGAAAPDMQLPPLP